MKKKYSSDKTIMRSEQGVYIGQSKQSLRAGANILLTIGPNVYFGCSNYLSE